MLLPGTAEEDKDYAMDLAGVEIAPPGAAEEDEDYAMDTTMFFAQIFTGAHIRPCSTTTILF